MSGRNASSRRKAGLATDLSVETRQGALWAESISLPASCWVVL